MKNYPLSLLAGALALGVALNDSSAATLISSWNFNETSGTLVADSEDLNNGTAANLTFVASGAGVDGTSGWGNAGSYNGTTSQVNLDSAFMNFAQDDFSVTGWFNLQTIAANTDQMIISNTNSSNTFGWVLYLRRADRSNAGQAFFSIGNGGSGTRPQVFSANVGRVDDSEWHWFGAVVENQVLYFYVDGLYQGSANYSLAGAATATNSTSDAGFGIGASKFTGQTDQFGIYSGALTRTLSGGGEIGSVLTGGELYDNWQFNPNPIPEPSTVSLIVSLAIGGVFIARWRRFEKAS